MRYLSVVGTRPQYIKLSAMHNAFEKFKLDHSYIDTGQHYSKSMSENVTSELKMPTPILNLGVGQETSLEQISLIISNLDRELDRLNPEIVLVYGDTNSTLAATISAVKKGIKVAHIEAGLRSFDRSMPEEQNRLVCDHLSDYLFAPTSHSMKNLADENLASRSFLVGDVMYDMFKASKVKPDADFLTIDVKKGEYFVLTLHRPSNTDSFERLFGIFRAISRLEKNVILFIHPRLNKMILEFDIQLPANVLLHEPVDHGSMMSWISGSAGLITDSGGLQKEAYFLGVLCSTLRNETEWVETLEANWNILVKDLNDLPSIVNRRKEGQTGKAFGDGFACEKIISYLEAKL